MGLTTLKKTFPKSYSLTGQKTYVYYTFDSTYDELATPAPTFQLTITLPETTTETLRTAPTVRVAPSQEETPTSEETPAASITDSTETTETTEEQKNAKDTAVTKAATTVLRNVEGNRVSWNQSADISAFSSKNYQEAKSAYIEELGKVKELYRTIASELNLYQDYPLETMSTLLETPMTDVFKYVIDKVFFAGDGDYAKQEAQLRALNEKALSIERQSERLTKQLQALQENTSQLNDTVTQQLPLLKDWQETMTKITTAENEVSKSYFGELIDANGNRQNLL